MIVTANQVTAVRALLVCAVAGLIPAAPDGRLAIYGVGLSTVAVALDGVDGWIARRTGTVTRFGARFDMETDAVLVLVLSILAYRYGKAGAWVVASGLMRYGFLAAAVLFPWLARSLRATTRARIICVVQLAALIVILLPAIVPPLSGAIAAAALGALVYSFAADIGYLRRMRHDPLPS